MANSIPPPIASTEEPRALAAVSGPECHEDYELVRRLVGGDAAAWKELVLRYERLVLARVLATAREMNRALAAADAEDLCAEVFSRLVADDFAALKRFEGRSRLSTWLSVVTRRIAARRLAGMRSEAVWSAGERPSLDSLAAAKLDEPWKAMITAEELAKLAVGIAELGERQRELARLHYVEGCSYREISERLAMPVNSIGPTLGRIHEKLREHMTRGE